MQNLEIDKENTNPENFLTTTTTTTAHPTNSATDSLDLTGSSEINNETHAPITAATRPKFSFASNYAPRHFFSSTAPHDCEYTSTLPISATSFAVLNNYHAFSSSYSNKPNAIVHPTRRLEQAAVPKVYNGLDQQLRVTGYNPSLSVTYPCYFAEELNRKLSHLSSIQENRDFKTFSHHGSNQDALNQRPLFITTVPRGVFLPPPRELVFLSPTRKRQLYAYSSHPVIYDTTSYNNKNTHNGHKIRDGNEQKYSHRNTFALVKDKWRNNNNSGAGDGDDGGDVGDGVAEAATTNDGATIKIIANDNGLIATATNTSSQRNGVRGSSTSSTSVPGGLHISKRQFQQQLKETRSKRETPPPEPYKNIMHERRIVRGSNFAGHQLLGEYDPFDKAAEYRRRQTLRKRNVSHRNQRNVLGTPPPVKGRRHEDVQTDKYLEELIAKPTEASTETQTDLFLEKPPTPPYIPAKIGIDVATEIADGELFQFDAEAQPVIDVMVDSILELSILEVAHEQEISEIRRKQQELLAEREQELAELRRLEEEEVRLQAEKERRLRQDSIAKALDDEMQRGVTAAKLLQGHIASILPEVLDSLEPASDAIKKEQVTKNICPWLSAEVAEEVGQIVDSREILTVIIQEIIKQRAETYAGYKEELAAKFPDHLDEEENAFTGISETEEETQQPTSPPDVT